MCPFSALIENKKTLSIPAKGLEKPGIISRSMLMDTQ
jgi:hypothetical protein